MIRFAVSLILAASISVVAAAETKSAPSPELFFYKPIEGLFNKIEPCASKSEILAAAKALGVKLIESFINFRSQLKAGVGGPDLTSEEIQPTAELTIVLARNDRALKMEYLFIHPPRKNWTSGENIIRERKTVDWEYYPHFCGRKS